MDVTTRSTENDGVRKGDSRRMGETRRIGSAGRMLDRSRDAAILAAAMEGLAAVGYDRLTMEWIANRARAGKGALYRRWESKAALVVDAVMAGRRQLPVDPPDTGSLRGDLAAAVAAIPESGAESGGFVSLVASLATAAARDPELRAALSDHVLEIPRQAMKALLDRAVARGEIPADRPLELVPDLVISINLLRVICGNRVDRSFVRKVFDEVVLPLATAQPAQAAPAVTSESASTSEPESLFAPESASPAEQSLAEMG